MYSSIAHQLTGNMIRILTWYGCMLPNCRFRIHFTKWHRFYADKDSDSD
jgi:hypothetical protein